MANKIKELVNDLNSIEFNLRDNIGIDSSETFGIEIEFENANLDEIKESNNWKVKSDDSVTINNIGGELVSPVFTDAVDTWKQINNKCKYLEKKGAIVTPKTAAHIHIGSQILKGDPNNIRKFLKLWELFENIIFYYSYGKDSGPRLTLKQYSRPVSLDLYKIRKSKMGYDKYSSPYDWYQFLQRQHFDKHAGLNFKNYKGYEIDEGNTIEIRCPNGTLDARIWQNNINLFSSILNVVTKNNFDETLIDYYLSKKELEEYSIAGMNFVDIDKAILLSQIVFDEELDKLLFLKQYLKLFDEKKVYTKNKNHSV